MAESAVPRPRGHVPAVCAVGLSSLALLCVWWLDSSLMRETSGLVLITLILGTTLHRLCLLTEEWLFHLQQRYSGSIFQIFCACFSRATVAGLSVVILLLVVGGCEWTRERGILCVLTCAFYLPLKIVGVLGPAPVEISEVCESRKLNVAHGLAWSFYLGYLKLVIPGLEEQVKKHQNQSGDNLYSSRLHILLPLNAVTPANMEEDDHNIRFHKNLPEMRIDRAGVRGRVYKHSVYKIVSEQEPYYCVVEYATPLLTLYQMSQDSTAEFSVQDRRQQVLLFYRTLSDILERSLECRNRYCLILLDDQRADIDPHYLSTEIIKHLQQQRREIRMDLQEELCQPVPERGVFQAPPHIHQQEEPFSSLPSLMISEPRTLRSEPEENTDYTQNYHPHNRLHAPHAASCT